MSKGYITDPATGKKFPFVQVDRQKYATSILWAEAQAVAEDSFQFAPVQLVMPSYGDIQLQEIYVVCYTNRVAALTSLVPDLVYFTINGDNSAGYALGSFPAGVSLDPTLARFSLKGNQHIQNLGMRFTRTTSTFIFAFITEVGLLVGDANNLAVRLVFEDVDK